MPKCRYSHCKHAGEPVEKETGVQVGNNYYHADCYREKEKIAEVIDYYVNYFDKDPIYTSLRQVINRLVYEKGKTPDFLLFALRYAHNHNISIYNPPGIFYAIKDMGMLAAWNAHYNMKKQLQSDVSVPDLTPVDGYNNNSHKRGWAGKIISKGGINALRRETGSNGNRDADRTSKLPARRE